MIPVEAPPLKELSDFPPMEVKRLFVEAVVAASSCRRFARANAFVGTASASACEEEGRAHIANAKSLVAVMRERGLTIPRRPRAEFGKFMMRQLVWK